MAYSVGDIQKWAAGNPDLVKNNPDLVPLAGTKKKERKYHNEPVTGADGETYGSGKEAADAQNFILAVHAGKYVLYAHHVRVKLPAGIIMELDHLVVDDQLKVWVFETKGISKKTGKPRMTRDWRNKQKLFEEKYHLKIQII
jgi:hypothetical protein